MPTSPGMPLGKSTICTRRRYPLERNCLCQNRYISRGMPVSVFSQPDSMLLMARPPSVHSVFGNRDTCTSVRPFDTARWTMTIRRRSASSSDTPDGLLQPVDQRLLLGLRRSLVAHILGRLLRLLQGDLLHQILRRRQFDRLVLFGGVSVWLGFLAIGLFLSSSKVKLSRCRPRRFDLGQVALAARSGLGFRVYARASATAISRIPG